MKAATVIMSKRRPVSKIDWKISERVSLEKWDATEPVWNRIGPAKITKIETGQYCESGVMITVRNYRGSEQELDATWLTKIV